MLTRNSLSYLQNWLVESRRKPLVMRGARQVGKTSLVRALAEASGHQLVELNFERYPEYKTLFRSNDPKATLQLIEAQLNKEIDSNNSILFLDEIQVMPELLAKLRWFYEELPELAVVAAGSLLDFVLDDHDFSMPVGRITYFHLEPLSFEEFLKAKKFDKMVEFLHSYKINNPMPEAIHDKCMQLFKEYTLIGGMPAIVNSWVNKQSLSEISALQHDLLTTFRDDFTKYAKRIAPDFLDEIFNAIPTMLGGKFVYSHVNKELSQIKLKAALNLLCKARVCHKVKCAAGNGIPLAAEVNEKLFKVLMLDTGLASAKLGLNLAQLEQISDLNLIHQGGLSEQVVGQLLRTTELQYIEPSLYYWTRSAKNANAELDYLIQHGPTVIPIEVKSGKTGSLKSLHLFMHLKKLQRAVRINADLPSVVTVNSLLHDKSTVSYELLSLPFYLVEQLPRLL